jgi:hypothetical protein
VFLLKAVLHDWSELYNVKILIHLRNAATPDTVLLILDNVMPSAQARSDINVQTISNTQGLDPPNLLSTGFCSVTNKAWTLDGTVSVIV